ncbi:MAG: hypothetical protein EOP04_17200, partial [Proteobacteria bacterium]
MTVSPLAYYSDLFETLPVNKFKGTLAPHKPLLLLTIIDGISRGHITDNKIYLDEWLENRFQELWKALVTDTRFKPNIANPIWHLQGADPSRQFWHLQLRAPMQLTGSQSPKSLKQLRAHVEYAYFDQPLWGICLASDDERASLKQV